MGKRIVGYDVAKSIAMFFVVLLHFAFYTRYYSGGLAGTAVTTLCVICVPLFFAVNGALLLPRTFDVKKHYKKTCTVVAIVSIWNVLATRPSSCPRQSTAAQLYSLPRTIRGRPTRAMLAGKEFGIPISGTMAHSWVMYFDSEFEAFKHYAETYPDNTILLVDTYNVLKSGVPNAIRTAREVLEPMGRRLRGIRIDSGDLTYLSIKARKMLDEAGLTDCSIVASNSLDEFTIESILKEGAKIDSFGVGERLITAKSDPVFEGVYKMSAVEENGVFVPRIKVSASAAKITNPGWKKVWRVYRPDGKAVADLITAHDETPDFSEEYCCVDSRRPWKTPVFKYCQAKEMQVPVLRQGRRVSPKPSLSEIQAFVKRQLDHEIWTEEQRFTNPHEHYLDMSLDYYAMKMKLLKEVNPNRD